MDLVLDQKQLTDTEKQQINKQVKAELIDHLYAGCLPGTIIGIIVSIALFLNYYTYTPTGLLIAWLVFFNVMMIVLTSLYFIYQRYKTELQSLVWEWAYSILMSGCALAWVPAIFLIPADKTRQYLALVALFLATTGYAMGTIGQFYLCVITLNIILLPVIVWCFLNGGIFYNIVGAYAVLYMAFMLGINFRSTKWFVDSLKLKLENTLVSYQANHDILTNLPNQRMLPRFLKAAIQAVETKNEVFAFISFSLNRMEMLSDSAGLQAANAIIQSVTVRLKKLAEHETHINKINYFICISRKDTFNIILYPLDLDELPNHIKSLLSILDEPFYFEQNAVKLTASLGISLFPKDGGNPQSLLSNADAAMLKAKQFGGNRVEYYRREINAQVSDQVEMEHNLYKALENHEFCLFYQPIVSLPEGRLAGMEALIRWMHPIRGLVSPNKFIPLAEETGLIIPIGKWVIEEACRQTKIWHEMGYTHLKVAVNLAEKQLREENFIRTLLNILKTSQFDPNFIELEITETAILDESVMSVIKELKKMGFYLAVDDFGTGYSGLSYLKRFSIDKLKIDQSFIRDIPSNNDSIAIVSAILAMAKELRLKTLAEGVETSEQLKFLIAKGCNFAQGYYFSKPLEAEVFLQLLKKNHSLIEAFEV